jgi:hypothetical protein
MLKLQYTEAGLHVEQIHQSVEVWLSQRSVLAVSTGQSFWVEKSTASFLLAADAIAGKMVKTYIQHESSGAIALDVAEAGYLEITIQGIWTAASSTTHEGVFIVGFETELEEAIAHWWHQSQAAHSVLQA